jgi:hypothetical protein
VTREIVTITKKRERKPAEKKSIIMCRRPVTGLAKAPPDLSIGSSLCPRTRVKKRGSSSTVGVKSSASA